MADPLHVEAAYRAMPSHGSRGCVIVVHEIFGLTPHIRSVCDRLAEAGYVATAPDLFFDQLQGEYLPYSTEGKRRGLAIKNATGELALAADIKVWLSTLETTSQVAVMGFCLGGTLAWLASDSPQTACVIGYYSVGLGKHVGVQPKAPVLMHFGRSDPSISAAEVQVFRAAHPEVEVHDYDAGHAFNRDDDIAYRQEAAVLAWQRTLPFLESSLAKANDGRVS